MREFNKRFNQTQDLESTFELAVKNGWSMERAFAELRITTYITLDLQSSDKQLALDELKEIKDTEENESVLETISELNSDLVSRIDILCSDYTNIYQELEQQIPEGIEGNDFYEAMNRILKDEHRELWKEL